MCCPGFLDMVYISLMVSNVATFIIPVIGLQIAPIVLAKQVCTVINLGLGTKGLYSQHYKEYFVEDFKKHLINVRNIKSVKLDL